MKSGRYEIAVVDCETDPFDGKTVVKPFCCEFYSDIETAVFWGLDCIDQLYAWLETRHVRYMIYAHNGGKFDFHFMHKYLGNPIKVIKSRIVSARLAQHTVRDSFAILPVALSQMQKEKFDYDKMKWHRREKHKSEILEYLHSDCVNLYKYVIAFIEQFGIRLTIGGTAMREIKKRYEFRTMDLETDALFRPYYFGGRVQVFHKGISRGPFQFVDVNSQYPFVMKTQKHPVNGAFDVTDKRPRSFKKPYFLRFIGTNNNALPVKRKHELAFDQERGEFLACSHELEVALDHGLVTIDRVLECHVATETITFADYVDDFYKQKVAAEKAGDKAGRLFAKLLLNSGYGKFGQNPDNFLDYLIVRDFGDDLDLMRKGYELDTEFPDFELWSRKARDQEQGLFDVSIAASITSAARALLLEGLQHATDPHYCDTDSIICREFKGEINATKLGAWKIEATAQTAAIAAKKIYCLYDTPRGDPIKLASKGGSLTKRDIVAMCKGKTITWHNQAPTFSLKRAATMDPAKMFITRKFKMTPDAVDVPGETADIQFAV